MTKKEKVKKILIELEKKFGKPKCALNYQTPFELLVAVILSAQCTDKRVNIVTEEMFKYVNAFRKNRGIYKNYWFFLEIRLRIFKNVVNNC